ncbi:MAG: hypothetical protein AAF514_06700, partial [Verrucomicrobiota bacterium]
TNVMGFNGDGPGTESQLSRPNGLFLRNENLYILDLDNSRIRILHLQDGQLTTLFEDPEGITSGRGLWVSPDENDVYFGSKTRIRHWSRDTDAIITYTDGYNNLGQFDRNPTTGEFLVPDLGTDRLWLVDPEGNRTRVAGGNSNLTTGPISEMDIEGARSVAYLRSGAYLLVTEVRGDVFYVEPDGTAHVLLKGIPIQNLNRGDGSTLASLLAANTESILSEPQSISVSPRGNLILTTNDSGFIRTISKAPSPVLQSFDFETDNGFSLEFSSLPGRIYVVESSDDLKDWSLLREVSGAEQSTVVFDNRQGEHPRHFYRVHLYP